MKNIILILTVISLQFSCNKKYDNPPANEVPVGEIISIGDLKDMFTGSPTVIDSNYSIVGNITTEETNGAFYKEIYMEDLSGAIKIQLKASGGLYIGDSIRIYVKDVIMKEYGDLIQLDNIDVDQQVVKIATEKFIIPMEKTISQLSINEDQSRLVKLNDVEFTQLGRTYGDAINLETRSRTLINCGGDTLSVRTSGYANFASDTLPTGNGSIIGIFTIFGTKKQFVIRDINEVKLDSARCDGNGGSGGGGNNDVILENDFSSNNISDNGWIQKDVNGGISWTRSDQGSTGDFYAKVTNTSSKIECETWLISPGFSLVSTLNNPILSFRTATLFQNSDLEVKISTNYNGTGSPSSATWVVLNSVFSTSGWSWVNSGDIPLSSYLSNQNVHIAFVYSGTNSDYTTWEVDNIIVRDQ